MNCFDTETAVLGNRHIKLSKCKLLKAIFRKDVTALLQGLQCMLLNYTNRWHVYYRNQYPPSHCRLVIKSKHSENKEK